MVFRRACVRFKSLTCSTIQLTSSKTQATGAFCLFRCSGTASPSEPSPKRNTLVFLAISDKLIEGSPQNSISTVPIMPWGGER